MCEVIAVWDEHSGVMASEGRQVRVIPTATGNVMQPIADDHFKVYRLNGDLILGTTGDCYALDELRAAVKAEAGTFFEMCYTVMPRHINTIWQKYPQAVFELLLMGVSDGRVRCAAWSSGADDPRIPIVPGGRRTATMAIGFAPVEEVTSAVWDELIRHKNKLPAERDTHAALTQIFDHLSRKFPTELNNRVKFESVQVGTTKAISQGQIQPNLFADPGDTEVVMFEASNRLTGFDGNQIWIGATGVSKDWGSCNVFVSQDGTNYVQIGEIDAVARLGVLDAGFSAGVDPYIPYIPYIQLALTSGMLSQSGLSAYTAASVVDGNTSNNAWHVDSAVAGAFLQVDLGTPQNVTKISIWKEVNAGASLWAVEYSDNALSWTTVTTLPAQSASAGVFSGTWGDVGSHRYWRIRLTNTPGSGPWYSELQLFTGSALVVDLFENSGTLDAGTTTDADLGTTLCYVHGEVIAYSACTITGQDQYTLNTYIRRGQMGTAVSAHSAGEAFLRLDDAVFKYTYDPTWAGKTLSFKFQSVNTFGNAAKDLSTITPITFTIPGNNPGTVDAASGLVAVKGIRSAHATYRPLSNPLTATDAGSNATINIAAFSMRVPGISDISLNSGTITALSYGTTYYIYYDDPGYAGGAVTYSATTTKENALNNTGRFYVGSITTPVAGGFATSGNNDGGSGAQYGAVTQIPMSIYKAANHAGNGALNNPQLINDGNTSTFGSLTVIGNSAGNEQSVFLYAAAGFNGPFKSATLKILRSVPTNSLSSSVQNYGLYTGSTPDGGATFIGLTQQEQAHGGTTIALGVLSVALSTSQNLSQVCIEVDVGSQSSQSSGSLEARIYGAWIEVVQ